MLPDAYKPTIPPFDHQRLAVEEGWNRKGYAYLLEMGLGKSRVTIDNFCLLYNLDMVDALFVLAPKSVYTNWSRIDDDNPGEVQKWLWKDIKGLRMHGYRAGRKTQDAAPRRNILDASERGPRVLTMNIEALSSTKEAKEFAKQFLRSHRVMFVIDESTVIKNPTSVRTKVCLELARYATYRRILTGSPSTGSLSDLWPQFEFLGPGESLLGQRLYSLFRARYCVLREMTLPGRTVPIKIEVGSQNVEELAEIVAVHSFRRRKKDCLDLPPKVYMPLREVEMSEEQKKAYNELRRHAMTVIDNSEVTTQIVITQLMRMHQVVCGHIKTDDGRLIALPNNRMKELLQIADDTDESMVIWAMYRPDAELIVKTLKKTYGENSVAEWHGGIPQADREKGEMDFQAGRKRFMVSTSAGARGRTWTRGTVVVYYANSHDLEVRQQSEDRTHRIGTTGTVTYIDLVVKGTVDEKIIQALRDKRDVASAVLKEGLDAWI